jgi:hypothetical protein
MEASCNSGTLFLDSLVWSGPGLLHCHQASQVILGQVWEPLLWMDMKLLGRHLVSLMDSNLFLPTSQGYQASGLF